MSLFNVTPIMKIRLRRFKKNNVGYASFCIFLVILFLSLSANFIANDRPILMSYNGQMYSPVFSQYSEREFGGVFETEANYRDPVVQQLIQQQGWMVWPMIRFADQTPNLELTVSAPAPPSKQNWLGTDDQGRDVVARILYGLRISILFGFGLTILGSMIGILVGAIQGYYGGWIDLMGQRLFEVWGGMPQLFITMILVSFFSPSIYWLFVIMLLFGWMSLVSIVRVEFLRARQLDYVRAARALGLSNFKMMIRHILPNALSSSLSQLPFILTANITALSTLDFLGYGLPPGSASLGELIIQAKNNLDATWLAFAAFFTLATLLSVLVFIGEAARNAFDPKQS
ncbi:MAG: ABC transporter permease [Candidatus Saccharibacteria bacterium]|nr:ABC transporter permease [Moraxellaceae bacterium]